MSYTALLYPTSNETPPRLVTILEEHESYWLVEPLTGGDTEKLSRPDWDRDPASRSAQPLPPPAKPVTRDDFLSQFLVP